MVICVPDVRAVMFRACLGRLMMAVPLAGGNADRGRQRDDTDRADEDRRARERRDRYPLGSAVPDPGSAHDDIDLQQQSTQICGLHDFRDARMRTERGTRGPRQNPQRHRAHIEPDPRGQHRRRGPHQHHSRPDQLQERERDKEHPGKRPFPPMCRRGTEVDKGGPERGERSTTRSQPAVGLGCRLDCHRPMMTAHAEYVSGRHHISTRTRFVRHPRCCGPRPTASRPRQRRGSEPRNRLGNTPICRVVRDSRGPRRPAFSCGVRRWAGSGRAVR